MHSDTLASISNVQNVSGSIWAYNMRGLQFIAFWLLLIFQVESQATTHQCTYLNTQFPNCNNSVLRVMKSAEMYQVSLQATEWQCYSDFCLLNDQRYRQKNILCNETCKACQQLQPQIGNDNSTESICMQGQAHLWLRLQLKGTVSRYKAGELLFSKIFEINRKT